MELLGTEQIVHVVYHTALRQRGTWDFIEVRVCTRAGAGAGAGAGVKVPNPVRHPPAEGVSDEHAKRKMKCERAPVCVEKESERAGLVCVCECVCVCVWVSNKKAARVKESGRWMA